MDPNLSFSVDVIWPLNPTDAQTCEVIPHPFPSVLACAFFYKEIQGLGKMGWPFLAGGHSGPTYDVCTRIGIEALHNHSPQDIPQKPLLNNSCQANSGRHQPVLVASFVGYVHNIRRRYRGFCEKATRERGGQFEKKKVRSKIILQK